MELPMSDEPENLVLKLLREIRAENASQFEELRGGQGVIAQGLNSLRNEVRGIKDDIVQIKDRLGELALAVDHHTRTLTV